MRTCTSNWSSLMRFVLECYLSPQIDAVITNWWMCIVWIAHTITNMQRLQIWHWLLNSYSSLLEWKTSLLNSLLSHYLRLGCFFHLQGHILLDFMWLRNVPSLCLVAWLNDFICPVLVDIWISLLPYGGFRMKNLPYCWKME